MLHQVSFNDYAWIMARQFERDRAAGIIHTYSIYESIGIAVQSAMFRRRFKNKDLAMALGITPSVASKKLRGGCRLVRSGSLRSGGDAPAGPRVFCRPGTQRIPTRLTWSGFRTW